MVRRPHRGVARARSRTFQNHPGRSDTSTKNGAYTRAAPSPAEAHPTRCCSAAFRPLQCYSALVRWMGYPRIPLSCERSGMGRSQPKHSGTCLCRRAPSQSMACASSKWCRSPGPAAPARSDESSGCALCACVCVWGGERCLLVADGGSVRAAVEVQNPLHIGRQPAPPRMARLTDPLLPLPRCRCVHRHCASHCRRTAHHAARAAAGTAQQSLHR
jgi:hypothetical protein